MISLLLLLACTTDPPVPIDTDPDLDTESDTDTDTDTDSDTDSDTDTGVPDTDPTDTDTDPTDTDTDPADTDTGMPDTDTDVVDTDTDVIDTDTDVVIDTDTDTGVIDTDTGVIDTDTGVIDTDTDVVDTDTDVDPPDPVIPVAAPDFVVCADGSGDFLEIQDAIDASEPGTRVSVCPGTYGPLYVEWSHDLQIVSTGGPTVTHIDGGGDPAVIVTDGVLSLEGFHVTGTGFSDPYYPEAAAFSIHEGDLTVSDCNVTDTTGSFTVLFDENFLAMEDVTWEDNYTDFLWYLSEGDNVDIFNNVVTGGTHESVVKTPDLDSLRMTNNLFQDITIATGSTAFELLTNTVGVLQIHNNVFYNIDDTDPWGGRLLQLDGVEFENNIVAACNSRNFDPMAADYNVFWDNDGDYAASVTGTGNLYSDPLLGADFALGSGSPASDAGNPAIDDQDGTVSDIGMYGGPFDVKADPDGPDVVTETITGTVPRTLTVSGGQGGGSYLAGEIVHVWADVDPQSEYVTGWAGSTDSEDWSTTVVMPDADTTVTASITSTSLSFTDTTWSLAGTDRSVLTAIPSSPRGLVLFYHSAAGNNTEIYGNAAASIAQQLYDDGYGIIAMDSDIAAIAGTGAWGDGHDDETLDLGATREIIYFLGYWDIPVVAWGVGSGGNFAHTVGMMLPADAVLSFCAPGRRFTDEQTDAPTAWFLAERDAYYPYADDDAELWGAAMEARGVTAELYVHPPTPLYDARFTRVTGIDAATSADIADALRAAGAVDADGAWLVTGEVAASHLGGLGLTAAEEAGAAAEIGIMAAEGVLYDEYAAELIAFLDTLFP